MSSDRVAKALVGTELAGRYSIDRLVGSGGFGVVYQGRHTLLDVPVAIKVLRLDQIDEAHRANTFARFLAEAKTMAQLRHPHIVRVTDTGVREADEALPQLPWLVMEWCEGPTLAQQLHKRRGSGGRSVTACWRLIKPVLEAVEYAHQRDIAHRDLKPENIIIDADGAPRVVDFGIAKVMDTEEGRTASDSAATRSDYRAFTPAYAAPEQFAHTRTGPWTDVHALGLIITEVLIDDAPYPLDGTEMMRAALSKQRPTPATRGVDVGPWEPIIARALAAAPSERYADAGALLAALERAAPALDTYLSDPPPATEATQSGVAASTRPIVEVAEHAGTDEPIELRATEEMPAPKRRWLPIVGAVAVAAAAAALWWSSDTRHEPHDATVAVAPSSTPHPGGPTTPVPTVHPHGRFDLRLLEKRLRDRGWIVEQGDDSHADQHEVFERPLSRGGQRGTMLLHRWVSSVGLDIALGHFEGPVSRRGGDVLFVHIANDERQSRALLKYLVGNEEPPAQDTRPPLRTAQSPWRRCPVPTTLSLTAVWGTSSDNVFVVGSHGVVLHFDGKAWRREESSTHHDLRAVWGRDDETFAAGVNGIVVHRDAHGRWREDWGEPDGGSSSVYVAHHCWNAIAGNASRTVVVGDKGWLERNGSSWELYDPSNWRLTGREPEVRLVWASAAEAGITMVTGIGAVYLSREPGRLEHQGPWPQDDQGRNWPFVSSGGLFRVHPESTWTKTWGEHEWQPRAFVRVDTSDAHVFAVGDEGLVLHSDLTLTWKPEPSGVSVDLHAVWLSDDGVLFAVGRDGVVLRRPAPE